MLSFASRDLQHKYYLEEAQEFGSASYVCPKQITLNGEARRAMIFWFQQCGGKQIQNTSRARTHQGIFQSLSSQMAAMISYIFSSSPPHIPEQESMGRVLKHLLGNVSPTCQTTFYDTRCSLMPTDRPDKAQTFAEPSRVFLCDITNRLQLLSNHL